MRQTDPPYFAIFITQAAPFFAIFYRIATPPSPPVWQDGCYGFIYINILRWEVSRRE